MPQICASTICTSSILGSRCELHDFRHGYPHKGCSKVVQRLFIELQWSYQSDRLSHHDMKRLICVTRSTNQIDHTWNKPRSGFFRATWASMSKSPTTKVMMQVIWLCRHLQSYSFTAAIRYDPKSLRAIIMSRDPCDHKNDSIFRRGLIISLSQWSFR